MSGLSVLTTNVFRGQAHVEMVVRNLGAQTCRDFEWLFVDAFHEDNRQFVADLAFEVGLQNIVHVPFQPQTHVGHQFTWNSYNQALLLSTRPFFFRLGVFRYFHKRVVELAAELAAENTWVSLRQRDIPHLDPSRTYEEVEREYSLEIGSRSSWSQLVSHCGMYSYDRRKMIDINGNNEALLIHHFEDVDMNCRATHLGRVELVSLENAFLRVFHSKSDPFLGKRFCRHEDNPDCLVYAKNSHELENYPPRGAEWFDYRGFPWVRCPRCRTVAVSYCDKYFTYLKQEPKALLAPIGVGGEVGRDIRVLDEDLRKLTSLQSKLELLASSHTDPRYLQDRC